MANQTLSNPGKIATLASKVIAAEVNKSRCRKNTYKLMLGQCFDYDTPCIASTYSGSKVTTPNVRFQADTFPICIRQQIPWNTLNAEGIDYQKLAKRFLEEEEKQILWRAQNSIVRADTADRKRLQKFYDNLGRSVLVLGPEKVLDIQLVVRTDVSVETLQDAARMALVVAVWDDVGFIARNI